MNTLHARLGIQRLGTRHPMTTTRLQLIPGIGIHCHDAAGRRWTTWSGPEQQCSECGARIHSGYVRYQERTPDRYLCAEHVHLTGGAS